MLVEYSAEELRVRDGGCTFGVQEKRRTQCSMRTPNLGLIAGDRRFDSTEVGDDTGDRILAETCQISAGGHIEVALRGGANRGASGRVHVIRGFAAFCLREDTRVG